MHSNKGNETQLSQDTGVYETWQYFDGLMQESVTPLLKHWSYVFLGLMISCLFYHIKAEV